MSHSRQDYFLGGAIASKLVGNDYAGPAMTSFQELSEEPHRSKTVPLRLNQNVNHGSMLIDSPSQIVLHPVDLQEDFVQKPFVAQLGPSPLQFGGIRCAKGIAPAPDRLVAQMDSSIRHHQFYFAETHGKIKVQPYALRDDLLRKSITAIRIGWHSPRITSCRRDSAVETDRLGNTVEYAAVFPPP